MSNLQKQKMLTKGLWDKVVLLGLAVSVCVALIVALWLADRHQVNSVWVLLAWNSIGLIAVVGWGFRRHRKQPSFIAFFIAWLAVHAALVTVLMGWVPMPYWVLAIGVEFFIGYLAAYWLFGINPDHEP
jgi:hypothetical protein